MAKGPTKKELKAQLAASEAENASLRLELVEAMARPAPAEEIADFLEASKANNAQLRAALAEARAEAASVVRPPTPATDPKARPPKRGPAPAWAASARRHR